MDSLLRAEWNDESDNLLSFIGSARKHETGGDLDRATRLVGELLDEARMETIFDLRRAWPAVVRRAHELDRRWKERAA